MEIFSNIFIYLSICKYIYIYLYNLTSEDFIIQV